MGGASWTKVREDALETKTVTQSRQSLRKMTPKSQCSRTVKDETSHRVCQTPGQLRTNAHASVSNTAWARQGTTMNHKPMLKETSREDLWNGRNARTTGEKSTGDVAMLRRAPVSTATTSGGVDHRQRNCGPRGATQRQPEA
uniref:Uncharacterized protein n=2 Tax=Oryza sativa TaxID=4530 RepID=Q5Z8M6_ORYSJ|nr:hypothetical protein [Oryza sativa Japonica Group]BAD61736.1 hypothetical protein [Oryza sativa Japonica Group]BAD62355.1 hypothetical protein [Oryza sativa Japonica Group]